MERRLAAILAADVVGYSRLMETDETGTLHRLKSFRSEIFDPIVSENHGRIVKLMGDGTLVEFASVVDAVNCAIAIQRGLAGGSTMTPAAPDAKIRLRIGINLGDVILDGDDIYGDGVNIAARLEKLAEPGGICITRHVYDQIGPALRDHFREAGEIRPKNISRPVRVYQVVSARHNGRAPSPGATRIRSNNGRIPSRWAIAIFVLLLIFGSGVAFWSLRDRKSELAPADVDAMAHPLPSEPSLAVLPFAADAPDEEMTQIGRGLALALIDGLQAIGGMFVVGRESSLWAAEAGWDPKAAAEQFGVRFVLRGRVAREEGAAGQVAVRYELVDAVAGRVARTVEDAVGKSGIAAAVVEIARTIEDEAGTGRAAVADDAWCGFLARPASSEAYWLFLKGLVAAHLYTLEGGRDADRFFSEAARLDPGFALAHAWRARAAVVQRLMDWDDTDGPNADQVATSALAALAIAPTCRPARWALGAERLLHGMSGKGSADLESSDGPPETDPDVLALSAKALALAGEPSAGIERGRRALRRNPRPPQWYYWHLGIAEFLAGRPEDAILHLNLAASQSVESRLYLVASYVEEGRTAEAEMEARKLLQANPRFAISDYFDRATTAAGAERDRIAGALRRSGLPQNVSFECLVRNICP